MKKFLSSLAIITCAISLSSCAYFQGNKKVEELSFLEKAPKIDIRNFFKGDIEAFAITQDQNGKITNSYIAKMTGKWEDNKGVLQQNFVYEDGKKDSRTWLIDVSEDGLSFGAVGHDVIEPAQGRQLGNAMQMNYPLSFLREGVKQKINFEDNFYLVDSRSLIGTSLMRKNGTIIGKSIISFKKVVDSAPKN